MKKPMTLTECPLCGSPHIKKLRTDYRHRFRQKMVCVPKLERHECPDCGEVFFDPDAVQRLEAHYLPKVSRAKIPV